MHLGTNTPPREKSSVRKSGRRPVEGEVLSCHFFSESCLSCPRPWQSMPTERPLCLRQRVEFVSTGTPGEIPLCLALELKNLWWKRKQPTCESWKAGKGYEMLWQGRAMKCCTAGQPWPHISCDCLPKAELWSTVNHSLEKNYWLLRDPWRRTVIVFSCLPTKEPTSSKALATQAILVKFNVSQNTTKQKGGTHVEKRPVGRGGGWEGD